MDSGGVPGHPDDLLRNDVFFALLGRAERGDYQAMVGGISCSTFSVARFKPNGAPVLCDGTAKGILVGGAHYLHRQRVG